MLRREDLERIVGVRADMGMAPAELYPNYPDAALLAAAPALALACLRTIGVPMDVGAEDAAQDLIVVLEGAGVDFHVEPPEIIGVEIE